MHCADDAERNSDHDRKAERESRKLGGDRNARHNLLERGSLGYVGIAKVTLREPADPGDVLDDDRLIEAEFRLDLRLFPRINVAGRVVEDVDDIAGHHPQEREDDHRYPEQRQEHQEEAPHQVSTQGLYPFIRAAADRICRSSWRFANTPGGRGPVRLNGTAAAAWTRRAARPVKQACSRAVRINDRA